MVNYHKDQAEPPRFQGSTGALSKNFLIFLNFIISRALKKIPVFYRSDSQNDKARKNSILLIIFIIYIYFFLSKIHCLERKLILLELSLITNNSIIS